MTKKLEKCFQIMDIVFQGGSNWVDSKFKAFKELIVSLITDLSPWFGVRCSFPPVSVRDAITKTKDVIPHGTKLFFSFLAFVFNASKHSKQISGPFHKHYCALLYLMHLIDITFKDAASIDSPMIIFHLNYQ